MNKVFELTFVFVICMIASFVLFLIAFAVSDSMYIMGGFIMWIPMIIVFDELRREVNNVWDRKNF